VSGPTARRLWKYVTQRLHLTDYFRAPGDGRRAPQIAAQALVWGIVIGHVLREDAFAGVEALVRGAARGLRVGRGFGDDALAYFTERLDPGPTRAALGAVVRQAKRNKALTGSGWIGLAVDGTTTTCVKQARPACPYCRPLRNQAHEITGYRHHVAVVSVVGTGVTVPYDAEPYGPGDSEYAAGQRVLKRAVDTLGRRCADYVVADGEFATAPFLHAAGELGLRAVVRLKDNLPELRETAAQRYAGQLPTVTFKDRHDRVEVWDAADFDPWTALRWATVRVLKYRQTKPDGTVIEALWLTDWSMAEVGSRALYQMAKSRWEVENETLNVAKTFHGMEHICHHQGNSLLVSWLILLLALAIERLYRLRYLHRGRHPVRTAINVVRALRLNLGRPLAADTS
jgi:Transposase DDE domain